MHSIVWSQPLVKNESDRINILLTLPVCIYIICMNKGFPFGEFGVVRVTEILEDKPR